MLVYLRHRCSNQLTPLPLLLPLLLPLSTAAAIHVVTTAEMYKASTALSHILQGLLM
jgi:hypothetical protein